MEIKMEPLTNQKEKVAVIAGGSNKVGEACAERLLKKEYKVVVVDINFLNKNSKLSKGDRNKNNLHFEEVNIFERDQVEALMGRIFRTFGRLDILVNNPVSCLNYNSNGEDWNSQINENLKGQLNCAQYAAQYMKKNKYGKIINVSMITRLSDDDIYCSIAEAGIVGMTKSLAQNLGAHNIHVNCIALGAIDSHSIEEFASEEYIKQLVRNCPLKRIGQIQDVVNAVLFLASDESTFITGNVLHISGGVT
jgi:3-oxoacyl-[acyl-carrier protein] reductase